MKRIYLTIAAQPTKDYPFCIVVTDAAGKQISQEHLVRSRRDGIIFGNGLRAGLIQAGNDSRSDAFRDYEVNVVVDPRIAGE